MKKIVVMMICMLMQILNCNASYDRFNVVLRYLRYDYAPLEQDRQESIRVIRSFVDHMQTAQNFVARAADKLVVATYCMIQAAESVVDTTMPDYNKSIYAYVAKREMNQ